MENHIDWTDAQKNAINARNSNILVSAAAGSGKTAVLVERVIKLITDEENAVNLDNLLIVTFTNAAAAEMKNKILVALKKLLATNPNNSVALKQLSLLPNAKICTIDSFCINLVRENFFKLDISQDFSILDETEQKLLEKLACDDVINQIYEDNNEDFKKLVELLSSTKSDENLAVAIRSIYAYMQVQDFPLVWLDELAQFYDPSVPYEETVINDFVQCEIAQNLLSCYQCINDSLDSLDTDDSKHQRYVDMLEADSLILDNIDNMRENDFSRLVDYLSNVTYVRNPSTANKIVANNRNLFKEMISNIASVANFTPEQYAEDCAILYPIVKTLISVVKAFYHKINEYKKERNAYTFADIEHFAIDLLYYKEGDNLYRTDLALELQSNFAEILVDEYQDTNYAQDILFEMLSNGKNRFMVGDIKQSIYRFRLAMPEIFNAKKHEYLPYDKDSDADGQKIILDSNFRSRKGICDYTNFVFSILMNNEIGEIVYNKDEYLNNGNTNYPESDIPCAQIKILETADDPNVAEAIQIAKFIMDKVNSCEQIDGRNICYSDFAILFRNTKHIKKYTDVFADYSIPVAVNNKQDLFDNNEITMLVSLLRVIDNPIQDVPLLATLMSPFYGYTPDEIASAKVEQRGQNLYSSISKSALFEKFNSDLDKYRKYASTMSVASFLRQVISETSYMALVSSMGNAEQRRLNVLKFISIAEGYDKGENIGLTSFMRYVDKIIDSGTVVNGADLVNTGSDSVVITTIHKSKGLEYPICILADSMHKYNKQNLSANVLFDSNYGIGLKVHNEENLCRYNSAQYDFIKNINTCADMSENLRVLYVAITRAKEQFVTFITLPSIESKLKRLASKIHDKEIATLFTKNTVDDASFILWTALLHKDGKTLREIADIDNQFITSDFDLSIELLDEFELPEIGDEDTVDYDSKIVDLISDKLSFRYDKQQISTFASKRTASSLDNEDTDFEFFARSKPAFLSDGGLTAAQKGSAMHLFMQHCDYESAKNDLDAEITRLVNMNYISQQQADNLDKVKLNSLFNSDFAKRMFSSDKIYREIKTSSFVPVNQLEDTEFNDEVLIQGILDCVFVENGEAVVVDYKTDRVNNEYELLKRYEKQLDFYKKSIAKTLELPVKETILYSFYLDKACSYK